jgi:hypothetical protein
MRTLALLVVAWCVVLGACGDDPAPASSFYDPNIPGAGGSGGSGAGYCTSYCNYVTSHGTGCEQYNSGSRCTNNCSTYAMGPCPAQWQKYVNCAMAVPMSCEMTDAGKLSLNTQGCMAEFDAFLTCLGEHDAGLCP